MERASTSTRLSATSPHLRPSGQEETFRAALRLWQDWNSAQERLTERMYEVRGDRRAIADLADQVDRLRVAAAKRTRELLDS
jgi:hypothetical protein